MKTIHHDGNKPLFWGFGIIALVFIAAGYYTYTEIIKLEVKIDALSERNDLLAANAASTTEQLKSAIDQTKSSLSNSLSAQQQNVGAIQQQLGGFQNQVGSLTGTLTTLQKLAKTDPELLRKYSKAYFLNENYTPARLLEIPSDYKYSDNRTLLIHAEVLPRFKSMIDAANSADVKLYAYSAYRSFDEQKALKNEYEVVYGAGTANTFSADQGYSEHQLGTALDMISTGQSGAIEGFDKTKAYDWMVDNAYKYGFVLSYPKNNIHYVFEPWHWRFVGVKLATDLRNQGKSFYDFDQRTIDEYLVNIFD